MLTLLKTFKPENNQPSYQNQLLKTHQ